MYHPSGLNCKTLSFTFFLRWVCTTQAMLLITFATLPLIASLAHRHEKNKGWICKWWFLFHQPLCWLGVSWPLFLRSRIRSQQAFRTKHTPQINHSKSIDVRTVLCIHKIGYLFKNNHVEMHFHEWIFLILALQMIANELSRSAQLLHLTFSLSLHRIFNVASD